MQTIDMWIMIEEIYPLDMRKLVSKIETDVMRKASFDGNKLLIKLEEWDQKSEGMTTLRRIRKAVLKVEVNYLYYELGLSKKEIISKVDIGYPTLVNYLKEGYRGKYKLTSDA